MKITVPATSANIGPGFDSVGVALSRYLIIDVLEPLDNWFIEHDLGDDVPSDDKNLLIETALRLKEDLQPHRIKMTSEIPLARGLGSSSSVIVAGIELANQLGQLDLTDKQKLQYATEIEGHPDNVAPAIFGNLVIASYVNKKVEAVVSEFPNSSFVAYIPKYELRTSDSRNVLPNQLAYKKAVAASSIANVAIAALLKGDLETAGKAIESDMFHEQYRQKLVHEFYDIKEIGHLHGAYATYLSGAGPTVMVLAPTHAVDKIKLAIEEKGFDGEVLELKVDKQGVVIE